METIFSWFYTGIIQFWIYFWNTVVMLTWSDVVAHAQTWIGDFTGWVVGLLPAELADLINSPIVGGNLANFVSALTYFVPIIGILAIVSSAYAAAAVIRVLRWVKAFIPTISG